MLKSLHSKHNDVFLALLRDSRQAVPLRQADLALRLGHAQATVSKVERGERRLDVIELRAWLSALEVDFLTFMHRLDDGLKGMPSPDGRFRRRATMPRRRSESRTNLAQARDDVIRAQAEALAVKAIVERLAPVSVETPAKEQASVSKTARKKS